MREQLHQSGQVELDDVKTQGAEQESELTTKFSADGQLPPVKKSFEGQTGTAHLAYETRQQELMIKVGGLINRKFGGDYRKAFDHFDRNRDGSIDSGDLEELLKEAEVGSFVTRSAWISKIIQQLDKNDDDSIQWSEFQSVFTAKA